MSCSKNCKLITLENRRKIVAAYLAAFKKTPLLMLVNSGECLTDATGRGTGWRADCLGDLGGFTKEWCHMRDGYPGWIREAGIQDVWKNAPVAWETCWDIRRWIEEGWSLRLIFNYALALHGSYFNNKANPLPDGDDVRPELERFLRRLGYRLVLKELQHPAQVRAGGQLQLATKWQNVGSAPCYKPYRLAWRLKRADGRGWVLVGQHTVEKWLPGSVALFTDEFFKEPPDLPPGEIVSLIDRISLPADLSAGTYSLDVAIVDIDKPTPVVQLGIKGRDADGWYPLSQIQVTH
jgi:hypothetical protein